MEKISQQLKELKEDNRPLYLKTNAKERRFQTLKMKAYYQIPEVKERKKVYSKVYYQIPEVKERKKVYNKAYYQAHCQISEVKEKKKVYNKAYYQKEKFLKNNE